MLYKKLQAIINLCAFVHQMDSGTSSFILSPTNLHSLYYRGKEEESAIDLGLSLRTMQPQTHQPGSQSEIREGCRKSTRFSEMKPRMATVLKGEETVNNDHITEEVRTQSREKWTYVKVNMDGVIVGRKIRILYHGGYTSLALQLEDMFGSKSVSGLRLFQAESEFSLFYKDKQETWRRVGDVSWNEFIECVKRLRITPRG